VDHRHQPVAHGGPLRQRAVQPAGGSLPFSDAFLNSFAIAIPGTLVPIAIAAAAAYALAWMDFKGRHWLFIGVLAMMAVPLQMALVPLQQLYTGAPT
jgi:alpha-glucoside transport system permease protein